jgi:DNA-directed RNA polymerase beta' subunit
MEREAIFSEIQFSVMSEQEILSMSALELSSTKLSGEGSVCDARLGPSVPDNSICPTCKATSIKCTGHFGHIRLNYPIFHPLFEKEIIKVLKIFCYSCFRFIRNATDGSYVEFDKIIKWSDKKYVCPHCGAQQPQWMYDDRNITIKMSFGAEKGLTCRPSDIRAIMASFNKEDLEHIGILTWPENMIITVLPIIPPCCRPSVHSDGKINDDHLTIQYAEIIKANLAVKKEKQPQEQFDAIKTLIWRIGTLFNNSSSKNKYHSSGKAIQGYRQRLSGKKGLLRENLMGKRVDQSGRTVIGPEPTLRIDQVAIPEKMAKVLTREEIVTPYNINLMKKYFSDGVITMVTRGEKTISRDFIDELKVGDVVDRNLIDGDIVLINRQPSLHMGSMIAFKTVVSKSKTICFNLSNAKSFNADFDGDEMNLHVPQKYTEVAELEELSSIGNHILSQRNGSANIVLVQDNILSLYLMAHENTQIERHQLNDITMFLVDERGKPWSISSIVEKIEHIEKIIPASTGRGIISLCFPNDFNYKTADVEFKAGVFVRGTYNKDLSGKLIQLLFHLYGESLVIMIINNLQFISNRWLSIRGFSVGFEDCLLSDEGAYNAVKSTIMGCFARAEATKESIGHERIREIRVQEELNNARNIGQKIAREGFRPGNNFCHTVNSGSKGDFFNIAQISGCLGQQYYYGGRINPSLNEGKRSLPHYLFGDTDLKRQYESRGFVRHSFLRGLDPREMFMHAVVGRTGVISTALSTADSGYMQRRIVKLTEDIHVSNDGTLRDETGQIYSFHYGDGLDVCHSPSADIVKHIVARLSQTS